MALSRRRLFQYVALTGGCSSAAEADSAPGLEMLRNVSAAHGIKLSDERLRVIQPVVGQRLSELSGMRDLEVDDRIAPTPGILYK